MYDLDLTELIDFSIFLGGWESETLSFLRQYLRKDDVIVEVGANVGAHTLMIAREVGPLGQVYAFEPTEFASQKLLRNIALNPQLSNIVVRKEIVSNQLGAPPRRDIRSSWKVEPTGQYPTETVTAKVTTLDHFVSSRNLTRIDLLKIDVDGYDLKVLQGSKNTLAQMRPVVFVELCEYALREQGDSLEELFDLLSGLGYMAQHPGGIPIKDVGEVLNLVGEGSSINAVFIPNDCAASRRGSRAQPVVDAGA